MAGSDFDRIYARVPIAQKECLLDFRADHPYKELDVGIASWRYIASGQGDRALVFLPGGFLAADMWFHSILALEDRYRIIVPDSFTLQGTFDMQDVCHALVRLFEAEDIATTTVIGLSAGGGVAQYFLQEHPERVEHMVLSHCGVLERDAEAEKALKRLHILARLLPLWIIRRVILRRTAGVIPANSAWIEFHNAFFQEAASRFTKEMFLRFLQSSAELRQRFIPRLDVVEAWSGEILILGSRDDELAVHSLGKLQARYPRARTHLFERGGHHTFMFFPEAYTATLSAFLQEALNSSLTFP
jgi:pimeloyl-ACP methyl ester carboxylesterase